MTLVDRLAIGLGQYGPLVIAALAAVVVWLAVTRYYARREVLETDALLWANTWAAIHAVNGTTPENEEIADEFAELMACAPRWLDDGYPEGVR